MPRIADYDYHLPPELVAQYPHQKRDASRLLVLRRDTGEIRHARFRELPQWLDENDVLVVNDTRVFPARLRGHKDSGGKVELLLHHLPVVEERNDSGEGARGRRPLPPPPNPLPQPPYGLMGEEPGAKDKDSLSPGIGLKKFVRARATYRGRLKVGQVLQFGEVLQAEVMTLPAPGVAEVHFICPGGDSDPVQAVLAAGDVPLPPYIHRPPTDADRDTYQTVFAAHPGAVACPTAGLHFTETVLQDLDRWGIEIVPLTLHVGPGTFMPVRVNNYTRHRMLPEYFELSEAAAARLNAARAGGKRLVAVGTTSVRVLESGAAPEGFQARQGWCDLYIYPGYQFKVVDRLLTNFHLPKSTLLLLVSAFAGRDPIFQAYAAAVQEGYRFYSYGDCMLIL